LSNTCFAVTQLAPAVVLRQKAVPRSSDIVYLGPLRTIGTIARAGWSSAMRILCGRRRVGDWLRARNRREVLSRAVALDRLLTVTASIQEMNGLVRGDHPA